LVPKKVRYLGKGERSTAAKDKLSTTDNMCIILFFALVAMMMSLGTSAAREDPAVEAKADFKNNAGRDGKMNKKEFLAFLQDKGIKEIPLDLAAALFEEQDEDKNGNISAEEFVPLRQKAIEANEEKKSRASFLFSMLFMPFTVMSFIFSTIWSIILAFMALISTALTGYILLLAVPIIFIAFASAGSVDSKASASLAAYILPPALVTVAFTCYYWFSTEAVPIWVTAAFGIVILLLFLIGSVMPK